MIAGEQQVDSMEALCLDAMSCGLPKYKALEWIKEVGDFCLDYEMYELMPRIHEVYDKIKNYEGTKMPVYKRNKYTKKEG